jgi:hypothetical protein
MEKRVGVVVRTVDGHRQNAMIAADARHELPKPRLNFLGNQSLSVSGAENQMDANIGVGMGHLFLQSP